MNDIQRADPSARRRALTIVIAGTLAGAALLAVASATRPGVEAWLKEDLPGRSRIVLGVMAFLLAAPLLGLAAYLWRLGRLVVGAQRFPPPGTRLIRDTPVVTGAVAIRAGRIAQASAAVLALVAVLLVLFIWRIAALLVRP